jgi:multidrug efflux pump subunit AcrA (membrane-fusion protein)
MATVYLSEGVPSGPTSEPLVLTARPVKLGIGDGTSVEVLEGLREGEVVVIGATTLTAASTAPRNPFGSPFGGPPRPR